MLYARYVGMMARYSAIVSPEYNVSMSALFSADMLIFAADAAVTAMLLMSLFIHIRCFSPPGADATQ